MSRRLLVYCCARYSTADGTTAIALVSGPVDDIAVQALRQASATMQSSRIGALVLHGEAGAGRTNSFLSSNSGGSLLKVDVDEIGATLQMQRAGYAVGCLLVRPSDS